MATVLVIEDDNSTRETLRTILTPQHKVIEAVDAAQGIEMARLIQPDLVLLALNLRKRHDGLEVCRTLRGESDPVLAQIPILIIIGAARVADINVGVVTEVNGYIARPFNRLTILDLIDSLLTGR